MVQATVAAVSAHVACGINTAAAVANPSVFDRTAPRRRRHAVPPPRPLGLCVYACVSVCVCVLVYARVHLDACHVRRMDFWRWRGRGGRLCVPRVSWWRLRYPRNGGRKKRTHRTECMRRSCEEEFEGEGVVNTTNACSPLPLHDRGGGIRTRGVMTVVQGRTEPGKGSMCSYMLRAIRQTKNRSSLSRYQSYSFS